MPPDRSHRAASVASTSATPYGSPHGSDWSTASQAAAPRHNNPGSQVIVSNVKPELSLLRQEILTEEEYTDALSSIIKRDFFPQLLELDAHNDIVRAVQNKDYGAYEESVRKMREIVTPTPHRRNRGATPGRTPFGTEPSDTPTYFSETPSRDTPSNTRKQRSAPQSRYDASLPLDHFQAAYTSEDNSSFAGLLLADNKARRERHAWAWEAERKANIKAIKGRETREKLVEMTRKMVEADKDGIVKMINGGAGRPGDRMLLVQGLDAESDGRQHMIEGNLEEDGRLMITNGEKVAGNYFGKGKGKEVIVSEAAEAQYVDWDKPTVEEEEDNRAPRVVDMQIMMQGSLFKNRNSFMFPPDADVPLDADPILPDAETDGVVMGEPKSIRYHATRLAQIAREPDDGAPSPTRSRIHAAITGTPYHAAPSATPKVKGFSFVDALPTPRAATIDPQSLQDLMTWGTIESTPIALRSTASLARSSLGGGGGPFKIVDTSRREVLAHKMAVKAKKSLSQRAGGSQHIAVGGLRRNVLDRSVRGEGDRTPRTPSSRGGVDLSPAAKMLLGRTGPGSAIHKGMSSSSEYEAEEESRRKLERARIRAREVESRERLKRERWSASPTLSLGFDPDLP